MNQAPPSMRIAGNGIGNTRWKVPGVMDWSLPDGSPDLYFLGFYYWNCEVGSKTLGIASF
jgi:hypothetical protein